MRGGGKRCSESAVLTDDDVTYDGTTYTIEAIFGAKNSLAGLLIRFESATPFLTEPLTLHVDGTRYAFADTAITGGVRFQWTRSISWTDDQELSLKITKAEPLPPPRKPPTDPNEPAVKPKRCACTQVVAAHFPERCSKCAIIRSCGTT